MNQIPCHLSADKPVGRSRQKPSKIKKIAGLLDVVVTFIKIARWVM